MYNVQGDVIGLTDLNSNVVALYVYDSWGKPLSITDVNGNDIGGNASHVANINPLRYRGYYWDSETGLYYLNSRYYDPETGRFINADGLLQTGQGLLSANMFAYCLNNPVNMSDSNGTCPQGFIGPCQGFACSYNVKQRLDQLRALIKENAKPIGKNVAKDVATGVVDSLTGAALQKWVSQTKLVYNIPKIDSPAFKAFGPAFHTTSYQSSSLAKGLNTASKITGGVATVAVFSWDIYQDYQLYKTNPRDFMIASSITTLGTIVCIGAGAICSYYGAPVIATIGIGIGVGGVVSVLQDVLKEKFIGY